MGLYHPGLRQALDNTEAIHPLHPPRFAERVRGSGWFPPR